MSAGMDQSRYRQGPGSIQQSRNINSNVAQGGHDVNLRSPIKPMTANETSFTRVRARQRSNNVQLASNQDIKRYV